MKVSIITTVNHNVGDDFVREGLKYLFRQYFKNEVLEFQNIHKHSPITSRYGFEWFRFLKLSRIVDSSIPKLWTADRLLDADIVVQSGAPVYWCHETDGNHCCDNEWYGPLIKERFLLNKNAQLWNLAAGTCQKFDSDGSEFCLRCKDYIKEFYELSDVTTVRDTLAKSVLKQIGLEAPVIPCSSIFAIDEHKLDVSGQDYVAVNYMRGGAHYSFGQPIDFKKWEDEFRKFYFYLKKKEHVVFACHNAQEAKLAYHIDPDAKLFYEKDDYLAYMKFYSKAKFGIMNRVHGAFLMASLGKPSVIIGNDSRARMSTEIGLENIFVNDASFDLLCDKYESLKKRSSSYKSHIEDVKKEALKNYLNCFAQAKMINV